ncbi:high-affinity nitrate transporter 3.2-like [Andrographis paniculata]|uniref:high-affinity nitrate transporter 3.2-like n=1 Tax=Andrographis paniculata TaxID=175694 RepID=UPI0021E8D1FA|nr:high-affinity nitrate transporter 3.2-like [Andrographis paniculata]
MAFRTSLFVAVSVWCLVVESGAAIHFSDLKESLVVTASPKSGQVLKAGEDKITVTWSLNTTFPNGADSDYKTVKVKLCYAPISQEERGWRKTQNELKKDKTCQHLIASRPYAPSNNNVTWIVKRDCPGATYFVRAYVLNSAEHEVAFGQTTDSKKTTNLFEIQAITGRHLSLDIASICFSAFSVVSLFFFFFLEKIRNKTK